MKFHSKTKTDVFSDTDSTISHLTFTSTSESRKRFPVKFGRSTSLARISRGDKETIDRDGLSGSRDAPPSSLDTEMSNVLLGEVDPQADRERESLVQDLTEKGNAFFAGGNYDGALRLYAEALKLSNVSTDIGDTASTSTSLSSLTLSNRSAAAKNRYRNLSSRVLVNIGAVHIQVEKYDEAISVLQTAVRLSRHVMSYATKTRASIKMKMLKHNRHDDINEARDNYDVCRRSFDVTADALQNMGLVHFKTRGYSLALEKYSEAVEARRKCLALATENVVETIPTEETNSEDHVDTINRCNLELSDALVHVGLSNEKLGNPKEAIAPYEEALQIRREALTHPAHADILSLLYNLGLVYADSGEEYYPKALDSFKEVHTKRRKKLGRTHLDVSSALTGVADVYLRKNDLKRSLHACQKAIDIAVDPTNCGGMNEEAAAAYVIKGKVLQKMIMLGDAIESFKKALVIRESIYGEGHALLAQAQERIAQAYCEYGEFDSALGFYRRTLRTKHANFDSLHPSIAGTLNNLGAVHLCKGEYSAALKHHKKALSIYKHNKISQEIALTHNQIGAAYRRKGEVDLAMEHYMEALSVCQESGLPPENPIVLSTIRNVADFEHTRE